MSKSILGIALAVVAFAIPIVGPAIGLSVLASSAIALGVAVAANVLIGPAKPKMPASLGNGARDRLYASLDVNTPRKILFGNTAGATDVRYQTFTGSNQEYLEQIVCVASHKVNSIYELWLDNEKAWDSTSGVAAKFSSFLTVTTRTEGTSANGIAIDSVWTATATLTGCAYIHLKYLLIHDDGQGGNDSPFASGVTSRMTLRCKGAFIYDPRLDSTVTGGSGSHRADTQSTWAWSDTGSRNPALQLLWYLLGWEINSKLAVGMGLPSARIDLPSFITAANACDESVTKSAANGGGTEPRYQTDGVLTEGDDRQAVVEALCASMNAVMRDSGGKLSLYVLHDDLSAPAASFDEGDVIGTIEWDQTPSLNQSFNKVRGTRTDPSDNALYQPVDYEPASLVANDGIERVDTMDYPLVQSNGQAQRLAKQRLQRNQYQGRARLTGKPAWWQVSVGDVIELSHSAFGWTDKLFRVAGQKISRSGETETVLIEENAAIYAWDNSEAAAVTPGTPTVYDAAANHPLRPRSRRYRQATAPSSPNVNDVWVDTSTSPHTTKVWDGSAWQTTSRNYANLDDLSDGSTYKRILGSQLTSGAHKLTSAGSGMTLGDQRNLPVIAAAGLRYKFTGTISYTSTTTSATISTTAGSILLGSQTISYNAMSVNVSGSGTVEYYLYVATNAYSSGAHTLLATTNAQTPYSNDNYAYIGYVSVTFTSGGSGGGEPGGGGFGCPWEDAWVETSRGFKRARNVEPGDLLRCLNPDRNGLEWAECESNELLGSDCWRIVSQSGIDVTVSETTPIMLRDGGMILPADIAGHELPVLDDDGLRWERCLANRIGLRRVAHIRCGNRVYAAGDRAGHSILTHNPKP